MLVTIAAAKRQITSVESVTDDHLIFTHIIEDEFSANVFLSFAFIGASTVAETVQTLCAAWLFEESMGQMPDPRRDHSSVYERVNERPVYYDMYTLTCVFALVFTILTDKAEDLSAFCWLSSSIVS